MRKLIAPLIVSVCLVVVGTLHLVASASSDVLQVTRADDPTPDGCNPGDCSFREAVNAANPMAGRPEIDILSGTLVSLQSPVTITGDVTITGHGPSSGLGTVASQMLIVSASGDVIAQDLRLFNTQAGVDSICGGAIQNDGTLKLMNVQIDGNSVNGKGGGLCNNGSAEIVDTTFESNQAAGGPGGAIYNNGTMTITGSKISNNSVEGVSGGGDGGGFGNSATGVLTMSYSTVTQNTSSSPVCADCSSGGGIKSQGTLNIDHSTFSSNHSDNSAAIQASGTTSITYSAIINNDFGSVTNLQNSTMTVANSTISNNLAGPYPKSGFGGFHNDGTLSVSRSTIADNTAQGYPYGGFFQSNHGATTLRSNLIANNGTKSCSGGNITSVGGNFMTEDSCHPIAGDTQAADAMIGPLADNGGPTLTRALLAGSPAIDHGSNYQCVLDQRGALRPVNSTCDAGAFEFGSTAPTLSPSPSPTAAPIAFPMGDADCNGHVDIFDITAELRLPTKLDQPSDCGRSTIPCMQFDGACFPVWTNTDCNGSVDGADALPILLYLTGEPFVSACAKVGEYPTP